MGCDIHLAVEHKVDGVWHQVYPPDDFERDEDDIEDYNELAPTVRERLEKDNAYRTDNSWDAYAIKRFKDGWYVERSYYTFSILANVRNGYGFAGVPTGAGFVPISMPKGLPNDMSTELVNQQDDCGTLGDHSHSWLTVKELLDYNWDQNYKMLWLHFIRSFQRAN